MIETRRLPVTAGTPGSTSRADSRAPALRRRQRSSAGIRSAVLCVILLGTSAAHAQVIKLGTLAPPGSPYEESLRRLGVEWARITRGRVSLKVYAGGVAGDEDDMIRKMRIGQLGAAAISGPALATIVPGVLAIQMPRLARCDAELDFLIDRMSDHFVREFERQGYRLLLWTRAGWGYIYSRVPVVYPQDLKGQRIWVWQGNPDEARVWRDMGFRPVPLASTDVMVQLQSGGVDAFASSPLVAAANQYFAVAAHMTDMKWFPFVGALVVSDRTWSRIPREYHAGLEEATRDVMSAYRDKFMGADEEAIAVMKKNGLAVHDVPPDAIAAWEELVSVGLPQFFAGRPDAEYYEMARRYLEEFRRTGVAQ